MIVRYQRRFRKSVCNGINEQSNKSGKDSKLIPAQMPMFSQRARHGHNVKIEPLTKDNKHGHKRNREVVSLAWTAHQYQNGHDKVDNKC